MARPVLKAKKVGSDGDGTTTITVPLDSGWNTTFGSATYAPAAGELIVLTLSIGAALDLVMPTITGFTLLHEDWQNDSAQCNFAVYYKVAVGGDTLGIPATAGALAAHERTYCVEIHSPVDTGAAPVFTSAGGINGGQAQPPAITPTVADSVVLCLGGASILSAIADFTQPGSELSNFLSISFAGGTESACGSGSFDWTSGAFTPAQWNGGGGSGSGASWNAVSLILAPAAAAGGVYVTVGYWAAGYAAGEAAGDQTLTPALFTNSAAFYAPAVLSTYGLAPAVLTNAPSFHTATVGRGAVALLPGLLADADSFYAATVTPGAVGLTPALVADADSFFAAAVTRGTVSVAPALLSDGDTFYSAAVGGSYALTAPLVANAGIFPAATVSPGAVALVPSLIADGDTFYSATVEPGAVGLTPSLLTNTQIFYAAAVVPGSVTLIPAPYSDADAFFAAVVSPGTVGLLPALAVNAPAFFAATILPGAVSLAPSLVANSPTFHAAVVGIEGGSQSLLPSIFANSQTFYSASIGGGYSLAPALFENTQFFHPLTAAGVYPLAPALLVNTASFHDATVQPGGVDLAPVLFANDNEFHGGEIGITNDAELLAERFDNVVLFHPALVRNRQPATAARPGQEISSTRPADGTSTRHNTQGSARPAQVNARRPRAVSSGRR